MRITELALTPVAVPYRRPGLGVQLDPEKVREYADLYAREGASYAFTDDGGNMPLLPKM